MLFYEFYHIFCYFMNCIIYYILTYYKIENQYGYLFYCMIILKIYEHILFKISLIFANV